MKRLNNQKILYFFLVALSVGALAIFISNSGVPDNEISVQINDVKIPVELAETDEELQKGLSGRASLEEGSGMLFVFVESAIYSFWMPDMAFPIDIIWINEGIVVDISENVSNDFDPENPRYYTPSAPVKYVLEVNAGFAEKHGIKIGDSVTKIWPSR